MSLLRKWTSTEQDSETAPWEQNSQTNKTKTKNMKVQVIASGANGIILGTVDVDLNNSNEVEELIAWGWEEISHIPEGWDTHKIELIPV